MKKQTNHRKARGSKLCHAHNQVSSYSKHYEFAQARSISAAAPTHPVIPSSPNSTRNTSSFHRSHWFKISAWKFNFIRSVSKMNSMPSRKTEDDFRLINPLYVYVTNKRMSISTLYFIIIICINLSFKKWVDLKNSQEACREGKSWRWLSVNKV